MRSWCRLRGGGSGGPWKGLEGFVEVEAWRGGTAGGAGVGCRCLLLQLRGFSHDATVERGWGMELQL